MDYLLRRRRNNRHRHSISDSSDDDGLAQHKEEQQQQQQQQQMQVSYGYYGTNRAGVIPKGARAFQAVAEPAELPAADVVGGRN